MCRVSSLTDCCLEGALASPQAFLSAAAASLLAAADGAGAAAAAAVGAAFMSGGAVMVMAWLFFLAGHLHCDI